MNCTQQTLTGKTIFWKWKGDDGGAVESFVIEDLGDILITAKDRGSSHRLNLPRREITIYKVV